MAAKNVQQKSNTSRQLQQVPLLLKERTYLLVQNHLKALLHPVILRITHSKGPEVKYFRQMSAKAMQAKLNNKA